VHDVIVVGGGFAGVTAAREAALRGRSVVLVEARDRLGGRTWAAPWNGVEIEYGGAWVHWHQPHTWSEITRAGLAVRAGRDPVDAAWYVGDERRTGTIGERDAIAERGWDRFVEGVDEALPYPHDPLHAIDRLARFDEQTIAERMAEIELSYEEREVLAAELESLAHGHLDDAGAVAVLRWHALSGRSLKLTQQTGGLMTIDGGTGALLRAIAGGAPFERRLGAPVAAVAQRNGTVEVRLRDGHGLLGRAAVVALPLNALGGVSFHPELPERKREAIELGQASRGIKIFIHARGEAQKRAAIRPGHEFGYLDTTELLPDGSQVLVGFGRDATALDGCDTVAVQRALDSILPGYEVVASVAHDWLADEFSAGTWAIHRPGWYTRHHAEMRRPEGRIVLAGSDLANGWSGFIDGAIESGLRAGALAAGIA
jgi:monoamine oxidase